MAPTNQETLLPEAPEEETAQPSTSSRGVVFGWVGVLAAGAAATALAVATLASDDNRPLGGSLTNKDDSRSAAEGSAEEPPPSSSGAPVCSWTSDVDGTPVLPAEDLGGPPTPQSVLTFESCAGDWTGRMAWLTPSSTAAGPSCPDRVPADVAVGDSGFPNPWAAGNAAAARYLCERNRQR